MKEVLLNTIDEILTDYPEIYLVELELNKNDNKHTVGIFIDTDNGLTLDQCSKVSKAIDVKLEEMSLFGDDQYIIEVSSPGLSRPLKMLRQFIKAIGKELELTYKNSSEELTQVLKLEEINEKDLVFSSKNIKETINYDNIVKATYHLKW